METINSYKPFSEEAEQAVLGGVLHDPDVFPDVLDTLIADDFYFPANREIYAAMLFSSDNEQPIDPVIIGQHLESRKMLDDCGGFAYLMELGGSAGTVSNTKAYLSIVKDKSRERQVIAASRVMNKEVMAEDGTSEERINNAMACVSALDFSEKRERNWGQILKQVATNIEERHAATDTIHGLNTGFSDIDIATCGLQKTDLIILAARPAMGKTTLAMNIASEAALKCESGVTIVFSMEMGAEQLCERVLASTGGVKLSSIKSPKTMDDCEWPLFSEAIRKNKDANMVVDDRAALTPQQVRSKCLREQRRHGHINLIVVDYLQLMRVNRAESRTQEVSEISRSLKGIAKEFNCPVIALSQLNRDLEKRPEHDRRPRMSDLRESGAIEQDADIIWFLYRDEVVNGENSTRKGFAELEFAKFRNGELQTVFMRSQLHKSRFIDLNGEKVPDVQDNKKGGKSGFSY